tara:strand:- start:37090 stop:37503 length:414 start_codon:yes stop_codon:yes gene_type:complete
MQFKLCYKAYDYKPNLRAIKQFKEATGLDLWSTLTKFIGVYLQSRAEKIAMTDMLHRLSEVIDFVDAAQLFYCLAKQDSSLTIDEIEDAMFHAGVLPSDRNHDMSEPYPFVIYMIGISVNEYHQQLAKDVKKPEAHS